MHFALVIVGLSLHFGISHMVSVITTQCSNTSAVACVVYGPKNETALEIDTSTDLFVPGPVDVLQSLPSAATAVFIESASLTKINPIFTKEDSKLSRLILRFNELDGGVNNVQWPASLTQLDLTGNKMKFVNASFTVPAKLRSLSLSSNKITSIDGWKIPDSLLSLSLYVNQIDTFNIDSASFTALSQIKVYSDTAIRSLNCKGTVKKFMGTADSASSTNAIEHTACIVDAPSATVAASSTTSPSKDSTTSSPTSSSSNSGTYIGIAVGVVVLIALIAVFIFRRRRSRAKNDTTFTNANSTNQDPSIQSTFQQYHEQQQFDITASSSKAGDSIFAYSYDIRSDPNLHSFRIPKRELVDKKVVGNGGFAIVYRAVFQDQIVAVKELQAVHTRQPSHIQAFMNEIKMFSTLQHDNIVSFVGVSWTTLNDLALITEFLDNGDLRDLLVKDHDTHILSWTTTSNTYPVTKLNIAVNVIDAITYLHSFEPKLLHRDLKSRNILLTSGYVAKLTDFGISRAMVDETMTSEAGTTAWTAPEVLVNHGRYNEKADVYSFGVVLSELDTWKVPYADASNGSMSQVQTALLVSQGKLKPSFRKDCPSRVYEIAQQCLSMDSENRPTAAIVAYELRNYLNDNSISELNPALGNDIPASAQLTYLNLQNNKLDAAVNNVLWPTSLTTLDLTGNTIGVLNSSFVIPPKLSSLILSNNQITVVDRLGIPTSLANLYLLSNNIDTFNLLSDSLQTLRKANLFCDSPIQPKSCSGVLQDLNGAPDPITQEVLQHKVCLVDVAKPENVDGQQPSPYPSPGVLVGIGIGVGALIAAIMFWFYRRRKLQSQSIAEKAYRSLETPPLQVDTPTSEASTSSFTYDIRDDPD
ncbi:kinase, partial [Thraustotheca clavata]